MYRREVDGKVLDFDHCGYVYQGSFVMFDKQTESEWLHVTAECVMGPLKGKRLDMEATRLITWKEWKALYPQTTVMETRRKWSPKSYERQDFAKAASRPKLGLNVLVQYQSKLYPYSALEARGVINDDFQKTPLVVVFVPQAACAVAWVRTVDAKALTFEPSTGDGKRLWLRDKETGSVWDPLNGKALSGPHKGKQLRSLIAIPIRRSRYLRLYPNGETYTAASTIKAAVTKSLSLIERGAAGSTKQRKCFTCHNQGVPVLSLVEARRRGFTIDEDNLQLLLAHTAASLNRRKANLLEGRGKTIIEGYALWTLEAGGSKPDETTAAVTGFLLENQKQASHWRNPGNRPPSVGSDFTTTYVALRGLAAFGTEEQQPKIEARRKTVRQWLLSATPVDTEDRVFRLRALRYVHADDQTVHKATAELIDSQRNDGGWAQTSDMKSDAYATGTVLVALIRAGDVRADHPAVRRGTQHLIDTQLEDGSWHVVSRAKPFQTYFESGFPHGKDQFISIAASSWATLALLLALPERKGAEGDGSEPKPEGL